MKAVVRSYTSVAVTLEGSPQEFDELIVFLQRSYRLNRPEDFYNHTFIGNLASTLSNALNLASTLSSDKR